jgi:hypothetical protein
MSAERLFLIACVVTSTVLSIARMRRRVREHRALAAGRRPRRPTGG